MAHLNPMKAGFTLGLLVGGMHLVWSVLVGLGLAQPLVDFVMWAHMVHVIYMIGPFDLLASVTLVLVTFVIGWGVGFVFATIWNKVHKS
jgi:hypothetical protein